MINFADIPKPHKFIVLIRGIKKSAPDIFKLFEAQNKGITTKSWTALSCEFKNGSTHMTIGVGSESFDALRERSNTLYCGMGKAIFTPVKGCKENRAALQHSATGGQNAGSSNSETVASGTTEKMDTYEQVSQGGKN